MQTTNIIICGTTIQQDDDGRYSLNDLHQAAGGDPNHQPAFFLRNEQTTRLVSFLESNSANLQNKNPVETRSGRYGGTYVCKELVYAYAMWISPEFMAYVIRTYDAVVQKALAEKVTKLNLDKRKQCMSAFIELRDHLIDNHSTDPILAIELAAAEVHAETGRDLLIEPGVKYATNNRLARLKAADLIEADRSMGKPINRDEFQTLEIEATKLAATLSKPVSQVFDWLSDRLDVPSEMHIPRHRLVEAINLLQLRNECEREAV
jgi:hypothetical protein